MWMLSIARTILVGSPPHPMLNPATSTPRHVGAPFTMTSCGASVPVVPEDDADERRLCIVDDLVEEHVGYAGGRVERGNDVPSAFDQVSTR